MKKIVLLALASLAMGAASAQEVTYVEDCSQGLLMNRAKDNWFITAQGGTNILFGKNDIHADLKNRWGGNAALYVGKWVTPTFGFRFGANWIMSKGACYPGAMYQKMNDGSIDGKFYPEKFMGIGPEFDVLINLTNWWCGYKPNRVYNATLHGGAGAYWTQARRYNHDQSVYMDYNNHGDNKLMWVNAHNTIMFANVGIMNSFSLSKHFELFIDVQYNLIDFHRMNSDLAISAGFTVNLGKTDWNCPVTAVCPTWKYTDAEGDALVARLANADNKIADLQKQLDDCLKRPAKQMVDCEGLCTVYYPINKSTISAREKNVLRSVANVMKENPNQKYILTGWADNYTGNDEINTRLRNERVNGVKAFLMKCGVAEEQLDARIDNNNLTDFGIKSAPLDRAVTIREAK
ncbi:MAG: hypothetical protein U0L83_02150 [Muribaculaceae bacterium]|nr:hypothetical protein [Muribaculaceae bacterium]